MQPTEPSAIAEIPPTQPLTQPPHAPGNQFDFVQKLVEYLVGAIRRLLQKPDAAPTDDISLRNLLLTEAMAAFLGSRPAQAAEPTPSTLHTARPSIQDGAN